MADLETRIHAALEDEGLRLALDPIEVRIAISRALLDAGPTDTVTIPLPVRELPLDGSATGAEVPETGALLDGLFELDELAEDAPVGGSHDA